MKLTNTTINQFKTVLTGKLRGEHLNDHDIILQIHNWLNKPLAKVLIYNANMFYADINTIRNKISNEILLFRTKRVIQLSRQIYETNSQSN